MTTPETAGDADSSEGTVVVAGTGTGTFTQRITIGDHELVSDEPRPTGDDAGPTPYDLLLGALGACTSMTVRMYARRKDWPLDQVRVTLRHSRIHAEDCADCETRIGMIDHIDLDIELIGDLDDDATATATADRRALPYSSDPDLGGSHRHHLAVSSGVGGEECLVRKPGGELLDVEWPVETGVKLLTIGEKADLVGLASE